MPRERLGAYTNHIWYPTEEENFQAAMVLGCFNFGGASTAGCWGAKAQRRWQESPAEAGFALNVASGPRAPTFWMLWYLMCAIKGGACHGPWVSPLS